MLISTQDERGLVVFRDIKEFRKHYPQWVNDIMLIRNMISKRVRNKKNTCAAQKEVLDILRSYAIYGEVTPGNKFNEIKIHFRVRLGYQEFGVNYSVTL